MNITSSRGTEYELQWDVQVWTVQQELMSYYKESREPSGRAWKKRAPDGLPLIHYATVVPLWSTRSPQQSNLWDLDMQVQGYQKQPNEWWDECQVACTRRQMYDQVMWFRHWSTGIDKKHEEKSRNQWKTRNQASTCVTINLNRESMYRKT